jgi:hypothetical protein
MIAGGAHRSLIGCRWGGYLWPESTSCYLYGLQGPIKEMGVILVRKLNVFTITVVDQNPVWELG